jgi:hypothetical protein
MSMKLALSSAVFVMSLAAAATVGAQTYVNVTPGASGVTASTNDGNLPANAVDGSLSTRWSASGDGQWLQLDLGSSRTVGHVKIAFYVGNTRKTSFDIQTSQGGGVWTSANPTRLTSSGTTTALETFDFPDVDARWVRYFGHGNTLNLWNSLTEVQVFAADAPTPTPTPTNTPTPTPTSTPTNPPTPTPTPGTCITCGWTQYSASYSVQKPYDLPLSDRFSYSNGIFTMWVYGDDKPFSSGSTTGPRTEVRVATWANQTKDNMFEADVMLLTSVKYALHQHKSNTAGEAIYIQVADPGYPTGTIRQGGGTEILATVGVNNWFHMNTSYNPASGAKGVWINGVRKINSNGPSSARDWYYKFGVYDNISGSDHTLSKDQYKNVKYWVK